jgi:hypothetical protein
MHYKRLRWIESLDRRGVSKLAGAGTAAGRECRYSEQGRSRVLTACTPDSRPVCPPMLILCGSVAERP